ncbi:MAG: molybdopterin-dependent oxidoreductase [Bacillota bacterium]
MELTYSNVCPSDCRASCRIKTKVRNGKIVGIKGDPLDEYTKTLCVKGYAQLNKVYAPDRIVHPMKQNGKGTGRWEQISWEQALTEIAKKLIAVKKRNNNLFPVCLNKYLGNMGLLSKSIEGFFNSIGFITKMVGSPCVATGVSALNLSFGKCKKPFPEDMLNADLIIIWGGNPAWTTTHQMRYIFEAREKGAKLVVIDPVLTATAARSDFYIQIKPGRDLELALGIAKVLLDEDLIDRDFLIGYSNGWSEFKALLEKVDLAQIEAITDISVVEIRNLARLIGNSKPMTIWLGAGVQHTATGGLAFRVISALSAMTGNIGVSGGNIHYATFEAWEFAGEFASIKPAGTTTSTENKGEVHGHRYIGTGRFAELMFLEPPIDFLWVAYHNPVAQAPDSNAVKKALDSIETVVVADQFLTSTAELADYFLPVASHYEYEDIVVSYWHYGAAINQKAIEPLGESRSDFEIMRELAIKLNKLSPGFSSFPVKRLASDWLNLEMEPQYPRLGIADYHELIDHYRRVDLAEVPWQDKKFMTPSGKYEFPLELALGNNDLYVGETGIYPFRLLRTRNFATHNSQYRVSVCMKGLSEKTRVLLHPEIANLIGVEEGMKVKIYNQLNEIVLPASLSKSMPTDIVVVYLGCEFEQEFEFNSIIALVDTDLGEEYADGKGLAFNDTYVNLVRA